MYELQTQVEDLKEELKQKEKAWETERQMLYKHLNAMKERLEDEGGRWNQQQQRRNSDIIPNNSRSSQSEVQRRIASRLFRICFRAVEEEEEERGEGLGVQKNTERAIARVASCMDATPKQVEEWVWGQKVFQPDTPGADFPLVWDFHVF